MTSDIKSPSDLVQVAFIYNGRQVETRVCERRDAPRLGKKMVRAYAPVFRGKYVIKEPGTYAISTSPKKASKAKPSKPSKVEHYFVVLT